MTKKEIRKLYKQNIRNGKLTLSQFSKSIGLSSERVRIIMMSKSQFEDFRKRRNADTVRFFRNLRLEVLKAYGNKCKCCGEKEEVFLCIDHVNNDGAEHRRTVGSAVVLRDIKRRGFPKSFQILCYNCNNAKAKRGVCPHQKTCG